MGESRKKSYSSDSGHEHHEKAKEAHEESDRGNIGRGTFEVGDRAPQQLAAVFENPLADVPRETLIADVEAFCQRFDLMDHVDAFRKGALVSQAPYRAQDMDELSPEDKDALSREHTHKWSQPWQLYWLVIMCSMGAAVQGMDEAVNNGAQSFYVDRFDIKKNRFTNGENQPQLILGLIVGAPYLACAILGCWITEPLNRVFARRGTIFISCFIAAIASIWQGVANSWVNLFVARFVLGLGIGSKSSTIPVYAAECSPAPIRGALVMMWQTWTAFGIMLGNIIGVAFGGLEPDLAWRLILGSTVVLPVIVCAQVYFCVESPRWLIQHNKIKKAFESFRTLRPTEIQAARDLYYAYVGVELERKVNHGKNFFTMFRDLFTVPRNRRATLATWIVMFGQQFCGVNIIAYYSTAIFMDSGYSLQPALLASMGTGILNFVFAVPAIFSIDTYGRRNLLLLTFPFLCLSQLWTALSFLASDKTLQLGLVATGMYLFEVFYSPGMGPVPFSYSAESFPLHVREVGMSWATATTWLFNFIISFTWPLMSKAMSPTGGLGFYAAWNAILWVLVLLFMPETKALTLEELDQVFSVPTWKHSSYQLRKARWWVLAKILRRDLEPMPPFYQGAEKLMEY